jgi:hypothetical protein
VTTQTVQTAPTAQATQTAPPAKKHQRYKKPPTPRVTIPVTREVIERAERRDSSHCMIAEAIREAVPGATAIAVDLQSIRWSDPVLRLRYVYMTPPVCQVALVSFDQGLHTNPFSFTLARAQILPMGPPGEREARRQRALARGAPAKQTPPAMPPAAAGGAPGSTKVFVAGRGMNQVPHVVGGKAPPTGALTNTVYKGKRRAFGVRTLKP